MRRYLICMLLLANSAVITAAEQEKAATQQAPDSEIHASIEQNLPKLRAQDKKIREEAVKTLHESLLKAANTRNAYPQGLARKQLSQELTELYNRTKDSDFSDKAVRLSLIYDLARYGDNEIAKPLILRILDRGSKEERAEALRGLGSPEGVSGDDLYAKIEDLARRKIITDEAKTTYLARIDKNRALVKILDEVRTTRDKRKFLYSAWTLQDSYGRPADFKTILPRLKELGLTERRSFDGKSDGLFWIRANLLAAYLDIAQGKDLKLALELMAQYSSLTRPASASALIRQLDNTDPQNRMLAARALEQVAGRSRSDKRAINAALSEAIQKEAGSQTKKALQDSLDRIAKAEQEWQQMLRRTGRPGQ
jgi:hypothetical protein